jgi:hypothetical protein
VSTPQTELSTGARHFAGATPPRVGALRDRRQVAAELKRVYRALRRRAGRNPSEAEAATLGELLERLSNMVPEHQTRAIKLPNETRIP